jgi:hypothetical protein
LSIQRLSEELRTEQNKFLLPNDGDSDDSDHDLQQPAALTKKYRVN